MTRNLRGVYSVFQLQIVLIWKDHLHDDEKLKKNPEFGEQWVLF